MDIKNFIIIQSSNQLSIQSNDQLTNYLTNQPNNQLTNYQSV
jgi:hypothetical protein